MKQISFSLLFVLSFSAFGQQNIWCTSNEARQVMLGNYNPANYAAATVIDNHHKIICEINDQVSTDSLKTYLEKLATFHNRNTYSDTVSPDSGIGAARRWVHAKFQQISAQNDNRLIPAYLQFDWPAETPCWISGTYRNVLGVLPGTDTADDKSIIIIEGHLDSRCNNRCDIICQAHGMEDNGSGTALVIELARAMSQFSFKNTIVFMATVGEEQGLYGAYAMAQYCVDEGISIKAVQNNDIVGGVICGATASPPGCPAENEIDSTAVRLFSHGAWTGTARSYARTVKLYYEEKLLPIVAQPMTIEIYNQEDRTGRGGDHIPFRMKGFTNVRFTSAYEHGDGSAGAGYTDRQHTSDDILGVDTDNDNVIDSFYVDFNYLARNSVINGACAALVAQGPKTPDFQLIDDPSGLIVQLTTQTQYPEYRVGVRYSAASINFDAVYRFTGSSFLVPGLTAGQNTWVSVASIDANGVTSPFSREWFDASQVNTGSGTMDPLNYNTDCITFSAEELQTFVDDSNVELLLCRPNPFKDIADIEVKVKKAMDYNEAHIAVSDIRGRVVDKLPVSLNPGINAAQYVHKVFYSGVFTYSLIIDGTTYQSRKMIISR